MLVYQHGPRIRGKWRIQIAHRHVLPEQVPPRGLSGCSRHAKGCLMQAMVTEDIEQNLTGDCADGGREFSALGNIICECLHHREAQVRLQGIGLRQTKRATEL
jgi:hypothetical protein